MKLDYQLCKKLSTGSPLRGLISNAIIQLNEKGFIANLKNRWWKRERGGGTCSVSKEKIAIIIFF